MELVGPFSNWDKTSHPMTLRPDGLWQVTVPLAEGVYEYAFIIDGQTWRTPLSASAYVEDGFGSRNAVLVVSETNDGA